MTLKTIQDMRSRSGVTLVELLVVILIVMILAVGLLPVFRRYVVESQYAAEPVAVIGHIRTQIALYQYEHNKLPVQTTVNDKYYQYEIDNVTSGTSTEKTYVLKEKALVDGTPSTSVPEGAYYLSNMSLGITEYQGNRLAPQHVQFAVSTNGTCYGFAVGVFGDGTGLPQNTGYAVYEGFFPDVELGANEEKGYKVVATWKNYTGTGAGSASQFRFGNAAGDGICAIPGETAMRGVTSIAELKTAITTLNDRQHGQWSYTELPGVGSSSTPTTTAGSGT